MRWELDIFLWLLIAIPLLVLLAVFSQLSIRKKLERFYSNQTRQEMLNYRNAWRKNLKIALMMLAIAALIVGIANPQVGTKTEKVKRQGIDIVLALDLSQSMLAEDIRPNRLERAKLMILSLLKKLSSDRVAFIVFAGNAYLQMPLTVDHSAFKMYLNTIDTRIIPVQGTNFSEAIELAEQSFESGTTKHKALIIFSDGENHDQEALDQARLASENGTNIYTIGVGTQKGGPIPIYSQGGSAVDYKKDKNGSIVLSKLNPTVLSELAETGNGKSYLLTDGQAVVQDLIDEIEKIETKEFEEVTYSDFDDQFQFFFLVSALLLGLSFFIPNGRRKKKGSLDFLKQLRNE
jgi:Ca-activated chloride channel family protein